nr:MAG TPA: hypothetical protein [Bacteriophage sp.]
MLNPFITRIIFTKNSFLSILISSFLGAFNL